MALPHYGTPINTDYEPLYKNLFEVLFTTVDNLDSRNECLEYVISVTGLENFLNYSTTEYIQDTIKIKMNLNLYNKAIEPLSFLLNYIKEKNNVILINQYGRNGDVYLKFKIDNIKKFSITYTNELAYEDTGIITMDLNISEFKLSYYLVGILS